MKRNGFFVFVLICATFFSNISIYAQAISLTRLLRDVTSTELTSLQKLERINEYKGETIIGAGRVKDALKSFGTEDKAIIYIKKSFMGKSYEVVLITDAATAETIKKGKKIRFEGTFVDMGFDTLRFENVDIISKSWWPF